MKEEFPKANEMKLINVNGLGQVGGLLGEILAVLGKLGGGQGNGKTEARA
jgi:hypothetical protein